MSIFEEARYGRVIYAKLGISSVINASVYLFFINNTIIDSAQNNQRRRIEFLAEKQKTKYCLLTHYHEDHSGNAGLLQKTKNITVFAHKNSVSYLKDGYKLLPYERFIWGTPKLFTPNYIYGQFLNIDKLKFQIIDTPGHSSDSVCILELNNGWIFTGDLIISAKPKYLRKGENFNLQIKSLKKLLKLDFETIFCAHKGVISENPYELIKSKIEYMETLRYNIIKLYKSGYSAKQIRNRLLGKDNMMAAVTFYDFSKLNMVKEIIRENI